nr:coiled-coil domain-containing protein 43 [Leptinotarsa decemlineata]
MAEASGEFSSWLKEKLKQLQTDETVFGSYIQGILEGDDTQEEKNEALEGLLAEIVENENEITKNCNEILEQWQLHKPKITETQMSSEDVNTKLAKLLESQSFTTTKQKEYTQEERELRNAILSQYSAMTDDEGEGDEGNSSNDENGLEKNINAQTIAQAEKLKREQARIDSQKKKERDREDREKQKQLKEEKKEKRKTVKGERKR